VVQRVYTIGHATQEQGAFVGALREHEVTAVADVRSAPHSSRAPWFSQAALRDLLRASGLAYVFLGRELGGRSEDETCFVGERLAYERLARTETFQTGLGRVEKGAARHRIALLCAEGEPLRCHRAILVSRHLQARGLEVAHIHGDGALEAHEALEGRMLSECRLGDGDLFEPHAERLARAYEAWGERIAWRRPRA
jgi:uncharacterized protein (DUF488 family)